MTERFAPRRLNELCGTGLGSRMAVSTSNLLPGWRFVASLIIIDTAGLSYKSQVSNSVTTKTLTIIFAGQVQFYIICLTTKY